MEGSRQRKYITECFDPRVSRGSPERGQDRNIEGTERDLARIEITKHAAQFKSPTYTSNADDSGFVDLCPSMEDDEVWPARREGFLQSNHTVTPDVCSTPNRETVQDQTFACLNITNSSPIQVRNFQVTPITLRPYYTAHAETPKWNTFDPSKVIFNTVFDNMVYGQYPAINYQDYYSARLLGEYSKLVTSKESTILQSPPSKLSRGHSTIASLLNSPPLKSFHSFQGNPAHNDVNENGASGEKCSTFTNKSAFVANFTCKFGKSLNATSTITGGAYLKPSKRESTNSKNSVSYRQFDTGCKHECCRSGASDVSENVRGVDLNNNNLQLVQKYSDISDACASDTETSSEVSSSEEDLPKVKEIVKKSSNQNKRKAKYPRRSAVRGDPRFRGVTMWFQTSFTNGRSQLHMSAFYSNIKIVSPRRRSTVYENRCYTPQYHSDQGDRTPTHNHKNTPLTGAKTCASCKTRRTPLWRDAEDGTPLCNACGIRYKKYRLRCSKCWHIPKKEVKTYPNCPACGASLRFSCHKKSW